MRNIFHQKIVHVWTVGVNEEIWDLLPGQGRTVDLAFQKIQDTLVQGISSLALLADKLAKEAQNNKPFDPVATLHHVMGSLVLITQASWSLNIKQRELIKPDLEPPLTKLFKPDIAPTTKIFGDDLPKQLKDMTEASKAGKQLQRKAPEPRHHKQKPYDRPRFNTNKRFNNNNNNRKPFSGYSRATSQARMSHKKTQKNN